MTETTTAKVREEQVTGLTAENAHRVTMIREKGTDHPPVPFHFRKEHHGTGNYVHLYGNPEDRNELHSRDFKDWEAVAFKHPGYLEDMWKQACDAYAWSSFDPEIRGETDIMIYGEELHNDLQLMQEEERDTYIAAYRQKLSAQLSALSRCANPMVTGRGGFDYHRQENTNRSYRNRYEEFRNWRQKVLEAVRRKKEAARPEEEKLEKAWQTLKRDIRSSADTIHGIDTGQCRGYSRALFDNLFLAADSRNKADWLLGVNSSYAVCKAVGFGNNSLGRVQTPVLAAISGRYRERENHIPADSWPVFISLCKNGKIMKMRHVEDLGNRRDALELYEDCKAAGYARVTAVGSRTEEIGAPALYNLTELQKDANRYHNLTAIRVQEITQSLYEKKLISCPRTSSRLLPRDVYDMLPPVMEKLLSGKDFRQYAGMVNLTARKGMTGTQDTAEHHAIVITGVQPGELDREERLVYTLIVGRMLETFMPPCKVEYTTVETVCAARKFRIRTYRILETGWLGVFQREHLVSENCVLCPVPPELLREETLPVAGCSLIHRKSLPVSPYTDEELTDYMDKAGLGTVSTRTNIIRTLLDRKYIRYSGRYIIPTPKGLLLYETVRGMKVAEASLTSGWETELVRIERGELTQKEFLDGVLETVNEVTGEIFRNHPEEARPHGSM